MRRHHRPTTIVVVTCLLAACAAFATAPTPAVAEVGFVAHGSVNQVYTYGHAPGTTIELLDDGGTVVQSGVADAQGAELFKEVAAGTGYKVRAGGATGAVSDDLTVTNPTDNPPQSFYDGISLHEGFGYLPTRDGTLLSISVTFPTDGSPGPWPVVVDYSGYDPSQPGSPPPEAAVYPYRGYVTVGVNMRGTTCSGGAFDFFEPLQQTDGYDAIEALAAQPWSNGDVGMVGISYSGYSQLYVAATHPPHLRAITPLSPYAETYRGILYPGGILNKGFALDWATGRQNDAEPAAHGWVKSRIAGGDTTCAANQVMRLQSRDLLAEIRPGRFDERPLGDYLDTTTIADDIEVPTYLASQFQDEQTGGYAAELATILAKKQDLTKFKAVFTNGTHVEPLGPTELPRVMEFVDFYVGKKVPALSSSIRVGISQALGDIFDPPINLPFDRFTSYPDYASALAAYEAEPPVRIRWENGGKAGLEGSPYHTLQTQYPAWPIPSVVPQRWYLQPDGALAATAPTVPDGSPRGSDSYLYEPTSKRSSSFDGGTDAMWKRHPDVHWNTLVEGDSLSFTTPAFTAKTAYAGTASADLYLRSTAPDTDLEVTLTEVRPDGHEVYIQSGWLRASHRKVVDALSTELRPHQRHLEEDAAPLPAGQFSLARVEIFPFAHIVRPGSKLRINIEAPGGNQAFWRFDDLPGGATNEIAHSVSLASSIAMPRLPDGTVALYAPDTAPSCTVDGVTVQAQSMRNQPCRADHPARRPTGVTASVVDADLKVDWAPPAAWVDGTQGTPTGYRVTAQPGGQQVDVPAGTTTATFAGVTRGVATSFVVTALYGDGGTPGPPSTPSAPATVPVLSPAERFVRAAFPDLLGRAPSAADVAFWVGRIDGGWSRARAAAALAGTTEHRRKVVTGEYQALLGRAPDVAGRNWWADRLATLPTVDALRSELAASAEFYAKAGGTPTGYVDALYQKVLGRAADAGGKTYLLGRLSAGASRTSIATWLVVTPEADRAVVNGWYQRYLDRPASASERTYWVGRLQAGRSEASIEADLVGSPEYLTKA